jgi:Zn finger protein HypA/HybF involved in hydrogenase expression
LVYFRKDFAMKNKESVEKVKVKCLGWCEGEFMSINRFLRFCPKCKEKKESIVKNTSIYSERKILEE